ncbi:MAG: hypothetical protein GQ477_03725 [Nanohaloarchaea archaeon]|nr:hypothetical protein [Candidatus Nanohaloarchaea archaeon]
MIIPYCNYNIDDNTKISVYDFSELPLNYFKFEESTNNILTIPVGIHKINGDTGFYAIIKHESEMNIIDLRSPYEQLMLIFSKKRWLQTKEVETLPHFDISSLEEHYDAITDLKNQETKKVNIMLTHSLYSLII